MATKVETKKIVVSFRLSSVMNKLLRALKIDVPNTCREALQKEIDRISVLKGKKDDNPAT